MTPRRADGIDTRKIKAYAQLAEGLNSASSRARFARRDTVDPYDASIAVINAFLHPLRKARINFPRFNRMVSEEIEGIYQDHLRRERFPFCQAQTKTKGGCGGFPLLAFSARGVCSHQQNPGYCRRPINQIIASLIVSLVALEQTQRGGAGFIKSRAISAVQATIDHPLWKVNVAMIPRNREYYKYLISAIEEQSLVSFLGRNPAHIFGKTSKRELVKLYSNAYLCYAKLLFRAIEEPEQGENTMFEGCFPSFCTSYRREACNACPIAITCFTEGEGTYFTCPDSLKAIDTAATVIDKARNMRMFLLVLEKIIEEKYGD